MTYILSGPQILSSTTGIINVIGILMHYLDHNIGVNIRSPNYICSAICGGCVQIIEYVIVDVIMVIFYYSHTSVDVVFGNNSSAQVAFLVILTNNGFMLIQLIFAPLTSKLYDCYLCVKLHRVKFCGIMHCGCR